MMFPTGFGPNPPPGNSSSLGGISSAVGAIRFNTTSGGVETWDGTHWLTMASKNPETWQEWFDYYVDCAVKFKPDSVKRGFVHEEMQARFPGNYHVDVVQGAWQLVFATPADETWWHLKYD